MEYLDMQSARTEDPAPENPEEAAPGAAETPASGAPDPAQVAAEAEAKKLVDEAERRRQTFAVATNKLAQRESRMVEREQTFRQQQAEFERMRAEVEAQKKAVDDQLSRLRQLRENPNVVEAFKANDLDLPELVQRMANNNSPENVALGIERRLKEHIDAQAAEIKRLKEAEEARTKAQEETSVRAQLEEDRKWLVGHVGERENEFPELSAQPPGKIVGIIEFVGENEKRKNGGRTPPLDRVMKIAEDLVAEEVRHAAAKKAARTGAASKAAASAQQQNPAAASSTTPPQTRDAPAESSADDDASYQQEIQRRRQLRTKASPSSGLVTGERANTIGNRAASERATSTAPLSREELRKRLAEKYMT